MRERATKLRLRIAAGLLLGLVCVSPSAALGQSPFAGMYTGTFTGPFNNGEFAILLSENNTAIVASYDAIDEEGFVNENVAVNSDGSFTAVNIDGEGTSVSGTFTSSGVSGTFVDIDGAGTFSGTKRLTTGVFSDAGGYYTGTLSGSVVTFGDEFLGSTSGPVAVIAAADGVAFAFARASGVIAGVPSVAESGGLFTIASNGSINTTLLDGTHITGTLNTTTLSASGDFSVPVDGAVHSGTWSVTRQLPLPVPNSAPVAANDNYPVTANKTLTVDAAEGVLVNDSDPDGDPLTANLASTTPNGTLALSGNGGFTYTPDKDFSGTDSFTYRANDGLSNSNLATVTITVKPITAMPWLSLFLD